MVWADLRAMRLGGIIAVVLIALAVAIAVAIGAQERAVRQASARAADDFPLIIGAPGSASQLVLTSVFLRPEALGLLPSAVTEKVLADPRAAATAPIAVADVVRGHPLVGTTAALVTRWGRLQPGEGRMFTAEDEAVVGARALLAVGDTVTPSHATAAMSAVPGIVSPEEVQHRHEGTLLKIVGRMPATGTAWDFAVMMPLEGLWEMHGHGHQAGHPTPGVPAIVVKPSGVAQAYQMRADYRRDGALAVFPAEILTELYLAMGDARDLLLAAALLNALVVLLAITLLLVTLAGLRRSRYALLRALGATRMYVALTVWLGAFILCALGALLGVPLGLVAARLLGLVLTARSGLALAPSLDADDWLSPFAVALAGSLLGLVAIWPVLRLRVGEALRG
jgi:putative ABC transport system permease protein